MSSTEASTADPAGTSRGRVAVVMVMYNSAGLLPPFVEALTDGLAGVDFELVAVDNASPDDSVEVLRTIAPWATVVHTGRNGGYAAGINAGVAAAQAHDAVLVVNSDVRLGRGCVAELLAAVRRPGIGTAVPLLLDGDGGIIDSMRCEPSVRRAFSDAILGAQRAGLVPGRGEIITDRGYYDAERVIDWAEGSTQLISAACWQACGPWDESFFLYSEETEYNLRARDRGYATLFVPTARAVHLAGGSGVSNNLWIMQVINRITLFRRRHDPVSTALYWFATLLRETTRAALGRDNSRAAALALLSPRRLRASPGPDLVAAAPPRTTSTIEHEKEHDSERG